jgi:hypothetical protein
VVAKPLLVVARQSDYDQLMVNQLLLITTIRRCVPGAAQ